MNRLPALVLIYTVSTLSILNCYSQKRILNGFIRDSVSGEVLIGVNVYSNDLSVIGTTNDFGYFSIKIPGDTLAINFSYIGYKKKSIKYIQGSENIDTNVFLVAGEDIDEVFVYSDKNKRFAGTGNIVLTVNDIFSFSSIGGEADVINALKLLPGVQSGAEGSGNIYVRGGDPSQNLFLLDDTPLYYTSHLGGFLSVIDPYSIKSVRLMKGNFSAKYGGRLSSVLDIRLKDGDLKKYHGLVNIGLLSSKLSFEGPILKDRSSFILSFRRFNYDALLNMFYKFSASGTDDSFKQGYSFYDFNFKTNYLLNDRNRIYITLYKGQDRLFLKSETVVSDLKEDRNYTNISDWNNKWGNVLTSIRWNHVFSNAIFCNSTIYFSSYQYADRYHFNRNLLIDNSLLELKNKEFNSYFNDLTGKVDFSYSTKGHTVLFGSAFTFRNALPGNSSIFQQQRSFVYSDTTISNPISNNIESALYISDEIVLGDYIKLNLGIRPTIFLVHDFSHFSLEPRAGINVKTNSGLNISSSYSVMTQPLHLLSNSEVGISYNIWLPSTNYIQPEQSKQFTLGLSQEFQENGLEISIEAYLKNLSQQIVLKEGEFFTDNPGKWESKIETDGYGYAKGLELYTKKVAAKYKAWISYTWSKNERQFENINMDKRFLHSYDRPHNFVFAITYKMNSRVEFTADWNISSGKLITTPISSFEALSPYILDGKYNPLETMYTEDYMYQVNNYGSKNNFRLPAYHRLNFNVSIIKDTRWGQSNWAFNIYNVYNQKNPFFVFYEIEGGEMKYYSFCLFPIIPSVNYTLSF